MVENLAPTPESTLVIIKPDGVGNKLVGRVLSEFEERGFSLKKMELRKIDLEMAKSHYCIHKGRHYYQDIIEHLSSGLLVVMILEGCNAIKRGREILLKIREKHQEGEIRNVIHASDSVYSARKEIDLWFGE